MFTYQHDIPQCPLPTSTAKNYETCEEFKEPVYDPNVHLDLQYPEYIVNLNFETMYLKDIDFNNENDVKKVNEFSKPGLAYTAPFKILSSDGLRVLKEIIDFHLDNKPHLSKKTSRHPWCMRGSSYLSPFVRDFARCEVVTKRFSLFAGKTINTHSMPLNYSHVNVGLPGTGEKVDQWHIDSMAYVVVLMLSDPIGVVGGELQVLKKDRAGTDMKEILKILNSQTDSHTPEDIMTVNYGEMGAGIFMQGSRIFHQVSPVIKSEHGARKTFVVGYMHADVFVEDWTRFATFRDGDPDQLVYLEYARLVAWKANGMLDYLINKVGFDDENGKQKANDLISKVIKELQNGYSLLNRQSDDSIGFHDPKEKGIKSYESTDKYKT